MVNSQPSIEAVKSLDGLVMNQAYSAPIKLAEEVGVIINPAFDNTPFAPFTATQLKEFYLRAKEEGKSEADLAWLAQCEIEDNADVVARRMGFPSAT